MKIQRKLPRFDLGKFNGEWKDSYLSFYSVLPKDLVDATLSMEEAQLTLTKADNKAKEYVLENGMKSNVLEKALYDASLAIYSGMYDFAKSKFADGMVINSENNTLESISKDDIDQFDMGIIKEVWGFLVANAAIQN